MIWTLKVKCEWGRYLEEECIRLIEIDPRDSLYSLHLAILDAINFDNDHLFEFFAGRDPRSRKILFVQDTSGWDCDNFYEEYNKITLESIYPLPKGLQLFYHFDFGDDWIFRITKGRMAPKEPEKGVKYPFVVEEIGPAPEQYPSGDE